MNRSFLYDPNNPSSGFEEAYRGDMRYDQRNDLINRYNYNVQQHQRISPLTTYPMQPHLNHVAPVDYSNWVPHSYPYNFGHNTYVPANTQPMVNMPHSAPVSNGNMTIPNNNTQPMVNMPHSALASNGSMTIPNNNMYPSVYSNGEKSGRSSPAENLQTSNSIPNSPRHGPGPPIVTSDRVKGPKGCNLFVFHLPNEITNWDLYLLFRKYGTILSVHIMISKTTGLSRGFGFVSFAARNEAIAAIEEMNGFRLGKKRFKVQLKRTQDDNFDQFNEDFDDEDSFNEADIDGMYTTHSNSGVNTRSSSPNYTNNNHHKKLLKNDKSMENMLPLEERNRASSMDKIYSKSSSSSVSNVENNRNTTTNGYDNKRIPLNSSMKSQSHQSIDTIDLKNSPTLKRITKSVSISDATKQFEAIQINNDLQSRTTTVESGK